MAPSETNPLLNKPVNGGTNGGANGKDHGVDTFDDEAGAIADPSITHEDGLARWFSRIKFGAVLALLLVIVLIYVLSTDASDDDGIFSSDSANISPFAPPKNLPATGDATCASEGASEPVPPAKFRPLCVTHAKGAKARIVQTSLGEPSQQWATVPCYEPSSAGYLSASHKNQGPNVNGYGAPDAIINVDLKASPFSDQSPILGFGGAFTDATGLNYNALTAEAKAAFLELLFGKTGLGYALGRVPMNSCDFSIHTYSFDDVDGDFDLNHFDTQVAHDRDLGIIEMVRTASKLLEESWGAPPAEGITESDRKSDDKVMDGYLRTFTSPWSPPAWMKERMVNKTKDEDEDEDGDDDNDGDNDEGDENGGDRLLQEDTEVQYLPQSMLGSTDGSCLKEGPGPDSRYAQAWALYFSKFITAYKDQGVSFWAVTVQNEPEFPAPWEACAYTPNVEAAFVANHLGPRLQSDHEDVKIFMFDHNKDHVNNWGKVLLNPNHPASKYIDGTAVHWYAGGMDRLLDGAVGAPNLHQYQSLLDSMNVTKKHIVISSEACHCPSTGYSGGDIEVYWARAERYAHTILSDLATGSHGWAEWNFLLDGWGGPNHLGNLCDTPILAVPHRALGGEEIPTVLPWEESIEFGSASHGDDRTREELEAYGFPAKYLDVGLAVQPMYYYMGHISRYVRPGSRAVLGIMAGSEPIDSTDSKETTRVFRPPGQNVAGGGMNDLARVGVEMTVWPCEGSTRQHLTFNKKSQIEVYGHDWLGHPTSACFGSDNSTDFGGVVLSSCDTDDGDFGTFNKRASARAGFTQFQLTNGSDEDDGNTEARCLAIQRLANDGGALGPLGGAQVVLSNCTSTASDWIVDESSYGTGMEVRSQHFDEGEVCMTTGWPFLQIGAFNTPNGASDSTVIVLNESRDAANYVLYNGDEALLSGSIPPRSIQTVLIDDE